MKEAGEIKQKKDVERRASKARIIRYVVHYKLLNFMPPQENLQVLEGKQAMVSNMFGKRTARVMQEEGQDQMAKKRTRAHLDEHDAVRLI